MEAAGAMQIEGASTASVSRVPKAHAATESKKGMNTCV